VQSLRICRAVISNFVSRILECQYKKSIFEELLHQKRAISKSFFLKWSSQFIQRKTFRAFEIFATVVKAPIVKSLPEFSICHKITNS